MSLKPADPQDEELRKRIRTLTSLLHAFGLQKSPSKQPRDLFPFLRHFTTLLTCSDKYDCHAKKAIAVTAAFDESNQIRALVVAQNPHLRSTAEAISLNPVRLRKRSLEDVTDNDVNPSFADHIADVWAALALCEDAGADRELKSLEEFFLSRSYRKFVVRFWEDKRLCGGRRLYDIINEWVPNRAEIHSEWLAVPEWLLHFERVAQMNSRAVHGQLEWEFSDDTKRSWATILENILRQLEKAIHRVKVVKGKSGKKAEEQLHQKMSVLNDWCHLLLCFVNFENVVKSLLTETNMVESITTTFKPNIENDAMNETGQFCQYVYRVPLIKLNIDDEAIELKREPGESMGNQVYRYLRKVVAWHDALHHLVGNHLLPEVLKRLQVSFAEVPRPSSTVLTVPQIAIEFFVRFSHLSEYQEGVLRLLNSHHSDTFSGCIHAEATLMGLVDYFRDESTAGSSVAVANVQEARKVMAPVAHTEKTMIAVSKKCCWCCSWLGSNLKTTFQLPGTHGIMFPWDPPLVGVGSIVLKKLEDELWGELSHIVSKAFRPFYSRQSPGGSSDEETEVLHRDISPYWDL